MQAFILLALAGLCRAGGIPMTADYAISTHGPDRSFAMVQKTYAAPVAPPDAVTAPRMMIARGFLGNDWGWSGKNMALAAPAMATAPYALRTNLIDGQATSAPRIAKANLIDASAFATPITAAPFSLNLFGDRAMGTPLVAAKTDLIDARFMSGAPLAMSPKTIANTPLGFAAKQIAVGFAPTVSSSYVSRTVHHSPPAFAFAKPMIAAAAPLAAPIAAGPIGTPVAFAGKSLLEEKIMHDKLAERAFLDAAITKKSHLDEKLINDKWAIEGARLNAPGTVVGAVPFTVGRSFLDAPVMARAMVADKLMAGQVAPFALTDKWMGKAVMAPVAHGNDCAWLSDKLIASPLAAQAMLWKKK